MLSKYAERYVLQDRIDQLEERTPNRAHSELLSQQMGVMQELSLIHI